MRYTNILLPIMLLLPLLGFAQERSFGTLPLAQKPGASALRGPDLKDSPQYVRSLAIYNKLVQARGDFRYPVPNFFMRREERRVAGIDYDRLEIVLEEKAYEVCVGFGEESEAAIAFLLGHELTHYYEKHVWQKGFAAEYKDLEIGSMKLDSLADAARRETEADYLGGFLAYSAGFGLFDKGGEVLARLYKAYGMPENIPGYPSLADRQALGKRTAEKLSSLVDVFDMANLLTATGKYAEAYEFYRYVLMQYQSREIYNNLGVAAVLDALQYFNPNELKFRFPLELDLESSASKGDGMANVRERILRQAILHFDAAISLDPNYAPAYVNKACAYALLDDYTRARFYASAEAKQAAQRGQYPKIARDADVLLGILEAREGRTAQADTLFRNAAQQGDYLAAYNLKVLRNEPLSPERAAPAGLVRERIAGKALSDLSSEPPFDPGKKVTVGSALDFYQFTGFDQPARLFYSHNVKTGDLHFYQLTAPGYQGKTARGIGLGQSRADIVAQYGEPGKTVETPRGQIMVYKAMLFVLGADGKLERWANYASEQL
ncbi:MAG: hypothetical protein IAE84_01460 [Saprospiraceae bacterium]|nr:hypothetical protein [Saprospiraceae bacterium]